MMKIKINKIVAFLVLLATISCTIQDPIVKDEYKKLPKDIVVSFYDKVDTIRPVSMYDKEAYIRSFLKNFTDHENVNYAKPIEIRIRNKELFMKFEGVLKKQYVIKFSSKQHKKKFIFYTNYETISFPVLFMKKRMSKYSLYMVSESEIIIKRDYVSEGMFLGLGAGNSFENIYRFKVLKNE